MALKIAIYVLQPHVHMPNADMFHLIKYVLLIVCMESLYVCMCNE